MDWLAQVPEWVTLIITSFFTTSTGVIVTSMTNKKKYGAEINQLNAEIQKIQSESDAVKAENFKVILDMYKTELTDISTRFDNYITKAREEKAEMDKMHHENKVKIQMLEKKVNRLLIISCTVEGCTMREMFADMDREDKEYMRRMSEHDTKEENTE